MGNVVAGVYFPVISRFLSFVSSFVSWHRVLVAAGGPATGPPYAALRLRPLHMFPAGRLAAVAGGLPVAERNPLATACRSRKKRRGPKGPPQSLGIRLALSG